MLLSKLDYTASTESSQFQLDNPQQGMLLLGVVRPEQPLSHSTPLPPHTEYDGLNILDVVIGPQWSALNRYFKMIIHNRALAGIRYTQLNLLHDTNTLPSSTCCVGESWPGLDTYIRF